MFAEFRSEVAKALNVNPNDLVEPPEELGDLGYPCFSLAKERKKNPNEIAKELASTIKPSGLIKEVRAIGPYVNFFLDWDAFTQKTLKAASSKTYGSGRAKGKAVVEHTSINPNASPHVGRSRNAIIGDTLVRTLRTYGYKTEVHYYVNDMGKQIALLVRAAGGKKLEFHELLDRYVKANEEMEADASVEKEVFALLQKFEQGDKKTVRAFEEIVDTCVKGQAKILSALNIDYDHFDKESAFLEESKKILDSLEKTGLVRTDEEGRKIMDLAGRIEGESTVVVLARSDGTTLYMTRDVAYSIHKSKRGGDMNIVVLGEDQKLYHQQLSAILKLLKVEPPRSIHYSFVSLAEGKMSTRKGNVVLLEDFMKEIETRAYAEVKSRYENVSEKEAKRRARAIAVAAVRYGIIKVSPEKSMTFLPEEAVKLEGDTGPYLQYTYARAASILKKAGKSTTKKADLTAPEERKLLKFVSKLPFVVEHAALTLTPHSVATYARELAVAFNEFYERCPVLQADDKTRASRLVLVAATKQTLKSTLNVLGIDALEEM